MKIIFRLAVVLLLIALLASVLLRNKQKISYESESAKQVIKEVPVEVTPVKPELPEISIRTAGMVESSEEIIVVSTVQGTVQSVDVFVGKTVRQGDVIATADDFYALKEYSIAREAYEQMLREYDRSKQLSAESAVSGQQLEQLKIQLDGADTKQQSLKRRLDDTKIKAPVSGTINQVFVKKGGVLGNGSPVCEIVNPSGLKVTAHVTQQDLDLIEKGQPVVLTENSGAGNTLEGVVTGMGVKPDRTGLYPLNISLPAKETGLKPGMFLNAEIRVSGEKTLLVPWRIIRTIDGIRGVFIAVDSSAVFSKITTGKTYNEYIEVNTGIEEGALLITNGYQFLNAGDRLKIVKKQL